MDNKDTNPSSTREDYNDEHNDEEHNDEHNNDSTNEPSVDADNASDDEKPLEYKCSDFYQIASRNIEVDAMIRQNLKNQMLYNNNNMKLILNINERCRLKIKMLNELDELYERAKNNLTEDLRDAIYAKQRSIVALDTEPADIIAIRESQVKLIEANASIEKQIDELYSTMPTNYLVTNYTIHYADKPAEDNPETFTTDIDY